MTGRVFYIALACLRWGEEYLDIFHLLENFSVQELTFLLQHLTKQRVVRRSTMVPGGQDPITHLFTKNLRKVESATSLLAQSPEA